MNQQVRLPTSEPPDYRARFTTAEFLRLAELSDSLGIRLELVHGELERMNPPMDEHSRWQGEVYYQLRRATEGEAGLDVRVEIGIDLGEETVLGCDIALVRAGETRGQRMLRPEEIALVVEVAVTSLSRDLGMKCEEYARVGIPRYWVVDPEHRVVTAFAEPGAGGYGRMETLEFGEPLAVPESERTITLG